MDIFRQHREILLVILLVMNISAAISAKTEDTPHHYYDVQQNSLEQYDRVWEMLHT